MGAVVSIHPDLRGLRLEAHAKSHIGLTVPGRSAPRAGYDILDHGQKVGRITSGSFSATLDTSIAMGYVLVRYADPGQALQVDIRGRETEAQVFTLPFLPRPSPQ